TLSWGQVTGATSYTVKRGTASGDYPTTVSTNATSPYQDTSVINETKYYYMITAVNAGGGTDANAEVSATPWPVNAPGSFSISAATPGNGQITLTWGASSEAAHYTIKRGTSTGSYPTTVSTSATSPFNDTGLTNGTKYYYMITASNALGSTNASAEA